MIKNKTVAITGGAGFIGSNIARELSTHNNIIIIDNLYSGNLSNIDDLLKKDTVEFHNNTIEDYTFLSEALKDADYVFHQAAIASVPKSVDDPQETNSVNITGTLNVLQASREAGVKKVVFASSSAIYGNTTQMPITEETSLSPLTPYAASKVMGEYYCNIFSSIYSLDTLCLRYFNVYGPYQDPNSDYAAAIPIFIKKALTNEAPHIHGDGLQTRDFIYVKDVVKANILAAESDLKGSYNVACGKKSTIAEVADTIIKISGNTISPTYGPERIGDIKHSYASTDKIRDTLDFSPDYSLEEGLRETYAWYQSKQ